MYFSLPSFRVLDSPASYSNKSISDSFNENIMMTVDQSAAHRLHSSIRVGLGRDECRRRLERASWK